MVWQKSFKRKFRNLPSKYISDFLKPKSNKPIATLFNRDPLIKPNEITLSEERPIVILGSSRCCEIGFLEINDESTSKINIFDIHCQISVIKENKIYRTQVKDNSYNSSTYIEFGPENDRIIKVIGYTNTENLNDGDAILIGNEETGFIKYVFADEFRKQNDLLFLHSIPQELKNYKKVSDIGEGAHSKVMKVNKTSSNKMYACKIVSIKQEKSKSIIKCLKQEPRIMIDLDHENIVKIKAFFESEERIVMILELMEGEDLFKYVTQFKFNEQRTLIKTEQIIGFMNQLLHGIEFIHDKQIIHRDLKPHNILFDSTYETLKISDFGSARRIENLNSGSEFYEMEINGTPLYMAPEICNARLQSKPTAKYGKASDMWSLGIILYFLITGSTPFNEDANEFAIYVEITDWEFNPKEVNIKGLTGLLIRLLDKNQKYRITAEDALYSSVFCNYMS
ncbi:11302_t:CDS:1 [Diversispora eburnea]|uniref:11302_t:CDS:1 n=1 Tax=Diversispora eburnea TaxID=1213867 RepID=A0A9N8Z949_9GLOM|nr:11302_t:CDS:1 [Diversispora eburnea]